jgi:hypothetical protein
LTHLMKPTRKLCDTHKKSYKCFKKVLCNELGCFLKRVARRRPFRRLATNGAETGWRRFNHQVAALHKVNKARRQREILFKR